MYPEGRARAEEGAADPEEASIDKTLLHYITPDVRASPRSHNINACYISRPPSFRASSYFPIRAPGKISQISGKTFRARKQRRAFAPAFICNSKFSFFYANKLFSSLA